MDKKDASHKDEGCCNKLGSLWYDNKPLAIFLALLATIVVAGIVFCVVWFIVLPHKAAQASSSTPSGTVSAASTSSDTSTSTSASAPAPAPAPASGPEDPTKTSHAAFLHLRSMLDQ
jgi:cytoskeletal protein RodZ